MINALKFTLEYYLLTWAQVSGVFVGHYREINKVGNEIVYFFFKHPIDLPHIQNNPQEI